MGKKELYKADKDGYVIEISDKCVVYHPVDNVPAKEIAKAMNELAAEGVPEEWDWKNVERRLFEKGIIQECRT